MWVLIVANHFKVNKDSQKNFLIKIYYARFLIFINASSSDLNHIKAKKIKTKNKIEFSKTFSMNKWRSILHILIFWYPHGLKRSHRPQNRPSDPSQILPFRWPDDIDLSAWWDQGTQFFHESFRDSGEHGRATTENYIVIEIFPDIQVAFHDRLVNHFMQGRHLDIVVLRLEHDFGATESLVA